MKPSTRPRRKGIRRREKWPLKKSSGLRAELRYHPASFSVTRQMDQAKFKTAIRVDLPRHSGHDETMRRPAGIWQIRHSLWVTVIEEAIKYIDHLHEALRNKFTERGLPPSLQGLPIDIETTDMRAVVRLLANNTNPGSSGSNNPSASSSSAISRPPVPMGRPLALPPPVDCIPHPCERQRNVPSYLLKMRAPRKQDHR
ncbi:hypothetical protein BIW11_12030 [Tropilaelaps mercedesae]|uniref:Uncharacterized protein n=1 Tax=Tropilaelaps mercedesae TaxID=418985 RepID=A0A1V9X8D6_9ACAR|nr:hypothetical protein BIW11_12030 [Tropilaelaps mercedesae]